MRAVPNCQQQNRRFWQGPQRRSRFVVDRSAIKTSLLGFGHAPLQSISETCSRKQLPDPSPPAPLPKGARGAMKKRKAFQLKEVSLRLFSGNNPKFAPEISMFDNPSFHPVNLREVSMGKTNRQNTTSAMFHPFIIALAFFFVSDGAVAQTADEGLQAIFAKAAQFNNQFQQATTVDEQIEAQQKIIECIDSAIQGLEKADAEFLKGSALEGASTEDIEATLNNLRQNSLQRSFELSQLFQRARKYDEGIVVLKGAINQCVKLHGEKDIRSIEYRLKLRVLEWLSGADESNRAKWDSVTEAKARALNAFQSQDFESGSKAFQNAIDLLEELGLQESMAYGEALANFAELLSSSGKLNEAETMFVRAIEVNDQLFEKNGSVNANMRRSFAEFYRRQGKHEKALPLLDEADEIYRSTGNEKSLNSAIAQYFKGLNLQAMSNDSTATMTFMNTLQMLQETGQSNTQLVPAIEKAIYQSYQTVQKVNESAAAIGREAGEIAQATFGADSPQVADWLMSIARSRKSLGEQEIALATFHEAKTRMEAAETIQAPRTLLNCLSEMTALEYRLGRTDQSILLGEQAMSLAESIDGTNSMLFASRAQNLSTLYTLNGDSEKAEAIFKTLLPYLKKELGESNIGYIRVLNDRAENFSRSGQWEAAIHQWNEIRQLQMSNETSSKE